MSIRGQRCQPPAYIKRRLSRYTRNRMDTTQLGKAPVPGEVPQGRDPKYEPAYGALQDEIRKLSSLSGGSTDWFLVVNSAAEVLASIAKDIPAAVYLAVGLGQTEGLAGWARGTQVCADVLTEYWETAFPPLARVRARTNSLDWWKERSLALLESWSGNAPCPWQEYAMAVEALDALDAQIAHRLPDHPPLYDVREALRRVPAQAPPAATPEPTPSPPSSVSPPPANPAPISAASSSSSTVGSSSLQSVAALSDACGLLHHLAGQTLNFLCSAEPSPDPLAWKIVYASQFGKIAALPPAEGGATAIPPPDATALAACRSHLEAGRALAGVSAAVAFAPACPLWLDVQRCVAEGLAAAGADYANALSVVRHECASLLERLPTLAELTFADGTPFADPATRNWLAGLASGYGGRESSPEETLIAATVAKAGTLAAQGNTAAALEVLDEAANTVRTTDGPACLRLRVHQLRLLCRETRFVLAALLAEDLVATMEQHALSRWQPALALEVWQAVHTAFAALEGGEGPRARDAVRHVARLSPAAALRLEL